MHEIISPLTFILNQSLSSGKVPNLMKIARVIPIFKKGQKDLVNNYRPISLLTSFSKILERLVYKRTLKIFISCKILTDTQIIGFRKKLLPATKLTYLKSYLKGYAHHIQKAFGLKKARPKM